MRVVKHVKGAVVDALEVLNFYHEVLNSVVSSSQKSRAGC